MILPEFVARWNEKRIKREITLRTIFINTEDTIKIAKKAARMKMRKARISPIPFSSQIGIWVCKERSIIWLLGEKPIAIMIRNEEISKGFRDFFDQMWEMSRKV